MIKKILYPNLIILFCMSYVFSAWGLDEIAASKTWYMATGIFLSTLYFIANELIRPRRGDDDGK